MSGAAAACSRRAVPARLRLLGALAAIAMLVGAAVTTAGAADASSVSLLAPAGACPGADDPRAAEAVQAKAIVCLVNWARRRSARRGLDTAPKLERASAMKGRVVVACGQFSHSPCGKDAAASVRAAGYRYTWFGENLWFGTWGAFSARQVVQSWLASPGHRANILRAAFTDFGVARARARSVFGEESTAIWVATFARPR